MWSFEKTELGYELICKNEENNINITIPYTYQDKDMIMYWNDAKIIKLVNDLNEGNIPITIDTTPKKPVGLTLSFKIPKEYDNYS